MGSKRPVLSLNPREKEGGFAPHLFPWVFGSEGPFRPTIEDFRPQISKIRPKGLLGDGPMLGRCRADLWAERVEAAELAAHRVFGGALMAGRT